jgi:hypothetical protein
MLLLFLLPLRLPRWDKVGLLAGWISSYDQCTARVDLTCNLYPIDKNVVYSGIANKQAAPILLMKRGAFAELGCGYGDIGAFFADLSSEVMCFDESPMLGQIAEASTDSATSGKKRVVLVHPIQRQL